MECIIDGVKKFAEIHDNSINFTFVGDVSKEDVARIKQYLRNNDNILLTFTGSLVPIPRKLFSKIDVVIAGSGCARLAAQEGTITIVVDARDLMSNGVLGIDTQNALFREEGKMGESIDRTLEKILIENSYDKKNISMIKRKSNSDYYKEHLQYFTNVDNKYYPSSKLCYPKEKSIISHIRLIGLLIGNQFGRIIQSEK